MLSLHGRCTVEFKLKKAGGMVHCTAQRSKVWGGAAEGAGGTASLDYG